MIDGTDMSTSQKDRGPVDLPPWIECDFFCIHDYAGAATSSCGWRGRQAEVQRDLTGIKLLCPRCGCATLFRIPLDRADG